jgi:hypothetical protein
VGEKPVHLLRQPEDFTTLVAADVRRRIWRRDAKVPPPHVSGYTMLEIRATREISGVNVTQCACGLPVPHMPQDRGVPVHDGASLLALAVEEAKTENFLDSFVEPQRGHWVPAQSLERTRISLSCSHFSQ